MEDIRRTFLFTSSANLICRLSLDNVSVSSWKCLFIAARRLWAVSAVSCKDLIYKSPTLSHLWGTRIRQGGSDWWRLPRKLSICFHSLQAINISPTTRAVEQIYLIEPTRDPGKGPGKSICLMDVWRECEEKHRFYFGLTTEHNISVFDDYSFW